MDLHVDMVLKGMVPDDMVPGGMVPENMNEMMI